MKILRKVWRCYVYSVRRIVVKSKDLSLGNKVVHFLPNILFFQSDFLFEEIYGKPCLPWHSRPETSIVVTCRNFYNRKACVEASSYGKASFYLLSKARDKLTRAMAPIRWPIQQSRLLLKAEA